MIVAIVVAVVPIALGMPLPVVLIPPAVTAVPAVLPRFVQVAPRPIGLFAVRTMMFHHLVQPVICLGNSPLAIIVVSLQLGRGRDRERSHQNCGRHN